MAFKPLANTFLNSISLKASNYIYQNNTVDHPSLSPFGLKDFSLFIAFAVFYICFTVAYVHFPPVKTYTLPARRRDGSAAVPQEAKPTQLARIITEQVWMRAN